MDVTLQRQDLLEIAERATTFGDSMVRIRTDTDKLIVSATGRTTPNEPISKVVADTLVPGVVSVSGTANGDPAELAKQIRALSTIQVRLVASDAWPGFELAGLDPQTPAEPVTAPAASPAPPAVDPSPHVAAYIESGTIKIRKPWTVPLFGTLTLGIYLVVWYHRINRELRDLGALCGAPGLELDVKPGRSTLAVSLFAVFIVPPFVSVQRTLGRVQKAEQITGAPEPYLSRESAWTIFLLVLPFWTAYVQAHLNRVWRAQLERAAEAPTPEPAAETETPAAEAPTLVVEPWPVMPPDAVVPAFAPPPTPVVEPAKAHPEIDLRDPAIQIVRTRYARGEITREEYRALLDDLA